MRTDLIAVYLGTGDLFDNKPTEILTSREGYAGNVSSWASLLTKVGYFFIDAPQGKVFLLGATLDEISNKGNRNWFRDNLFGSRNNPFFATGYTAAYDERFNRILLTKRGTGAFTISYSLDFNAWICHHDYLPSAMWNTRRNVYSYAHGDGDGTLVQHNDHRVKGKFYDATVHPSYIEPVFTDPSKKWFNISWLSEVLDENLVNLYNKTLTSVIVYTFRQCSGERVLTPLVNTRRTKSGWRTKAFKDIVKDKSLPFFDVNGVLDPTNLTPDATYWKKRKFQDNYLIVRFIYDNVGDNNLYLYSDANTREQIR